jgi:hypothetical protein
VQVPTPVNVTDPDAHEQPVLDVLRFTVTARPDDAVAVGAYVVPTTAGDGASEVNDTVCVLFVATAAEATTDGATVRLNVTTPTDNAAIVDRRLPENSDMGTPVGDSNRATRRALPSTTTEPSPRR